MKFKAVPYIDKPVANKQYRDFLLQKFEVGNLYFFNGDCNTYFVGWKGNDMKGWYRIVNPNTGVILEFFADQYKIKTDRKIFAFPFPHTLNDFILDCKRSGVELYWDSTQLDLIFDHKIYATEKESELYYKELLTKIEKENVF